MRLFLTGASGFVGRKVALYLIEAGLSVRGFDLVPSPDDAIQTTIGDLGDLTALERCANQADAIVHFGGIGDVDAAHARPAAAVRANVEGTINVGLAAQRAGIPLIYSSTWEVYGEPRYQPIDESHPCKPSNLYAATKYAGELALATLPGRPSDPAHVILRLGTCYGSGMRSNTVISRFIAAARSGNALTVSGSGKQKRQFTHTSDVGRAVLSALKARTFETFNIAAWEQTSISELAHTIAARFGVSVSLGAERPDDPPSANVSSARAEETLGWSAQMPFARGISEILELTSVSKDVA